MELRNVIFIMTQHEKEKVLFDKEILFNHRSKGYKYKTVFRVLKRN